MSSLEPNSNPVNGTVATPDNSPASPTVELPASEGKEANPPGGQAWPWGDDLKGWMAEQQRRRRQGLKDSDSSPECLQAALRYLGLGWSVLVLCPPDYQGVGQGHSQHCTSPGKVPLGPWKAFQDRLPTEDELLGKRLGQRGLNVGMALGPVSGLVGVDVDGTAGEARLQELSGGDLPRTLEFSTPGGGRRLLYAIPAGAELRTTFEQQGKKEEVRFQAKGAQTVLPPSLHVSGRRYAWKEGHGPGEVEPAQAPAWLIAQLSASPAKELPAAVQPSAAAAGEVIPEGARDSTLTSFAGSMRNRGMSEEGIFAALNVENETRCEPPLPEDQVRKIAKSVARYDPAHPIPAPLGKGVARIEFPDPIPLSQLEDAGHRAEWVWDGFLARRNLSLRSAYWKSGKTTLLAHLLKIMGHGGEFCGRAVQAGKAVVVSEEPSGLGPTAGNSFTWATTSPSTRETGRRSRASRRTKFGGRSWSISPGWSSGTPSAWWCWTPSFISGRPGTRTTPRRCSRA